MEDFRNEEQVFETTGQEETNQRSKKSRKAKKKQGPKKDRKLTLAMVAILTAFIVFIVLVVIQDRITNDGITRNVVVAIKDIPAGTKLTQENMPNYMAVEVRPEEQIPAGSFSNGYGMIDKITDRDIKAKEILTEDCFFENDFYSEVSDPVEISIAVGDLGKAVAGTLRAGDLIDIKTVIRIKTEEEDTDTAGSVTNVEEVPTVSLEGTEETPVAGSKPQADSASSVILDMFGNVVVDPTLNLTYGVTGEFAVQTIAENVRVVGVYTTGGESPESVEASGGTMIATVVNVVVPRTLQDRIYLAMAEGNIQLARIETKTAPEETVTESSGQ